MERGKVGDGVVMESERIGQSAREGVILEMLGTGDGVHYRVRWGDGHESTFYPNAGSISIIPKAKKAGSR